MNVDKALKAYARAKDLGANHEEAIEYLLIEMRVDSIDQKIEMLDDLMARIRKVKLIA